jgi:predicted methyltransferase
LIPEHPAPSRRRLLIGAGALALASCGKKPPTPATAAAAAPPGTLEWAVAGPWRPPADRQRDKALHPTQTLAFFSLAPGQTVVEMWPGSGWWTQILGPYLTANKGKLYAATFETPNPDDPAAGPVVDAYRKMIADKPDLYGAVSITAFGPHSGMLAPAGTADLVLFFDLDHWMAAGLAEKAFHDERSRLHLRQGERDQRRPRRPQGRQTPLPVRGDRRAGPDDTAVREAALGEGFPA